MKKLILILAVVSLIMPGIVSATCHDPTGDPLIYYGWGYTTAPGGGWWPRNQALHQWISAGIRYHNIYAGQTFTDGVTFINAFATYPSNCAHGTDLMCIQVTDKRGWTITGTTTNPLGATYSVPAGSGVGQAVSIKAPCSASICEYDTVIAKVSYVNDQSVCDPTCPDCTDPNHNVSGSLTFYNADTLVLHVIESPAALAVYQDSLTLVDRGAAQAYIPFSICNQDNCAPVTTYGYNIRSKGHVGGAINQTGTVGVAGGDCKDVYGIIDASNPSLVACTYDTLKIIAWTTTGTPIVYDTCVQLIHVIEPQPVPLFTVPVVTILVLALILAAAVFMRRRAVSRA